MPVTVRLNSREFIYLKAEASPAQSCGEIHDAASKGKSVMRSAPASRRPHKQPNEDGYVTCFIARNDITEILSNDRDMDVAVPSSSTSVSVQTQTALSDEEPAPIPAPVDAFNFLSSQASKNPTKRVKIASPKASFGTHISAPVDAFNAQSGKPSSKVLEVTNVERVKTLPKQCEVMDEALQHGMLKQVKAMFISWSKVSGRGMYKFGDWASDNPGISVTSVWSFINVAHRGHYVNLARINPVKLEAIFQLYSNDLRKWTMSIGGKTATCVSVVNTIKSSLQLATPVVFIQPCKQSPSKQSNALLLKHITAVHLSQEFDPLVGVCGMVFHRQEMHAQLYAGALTFGTKPVTAAQLAAEAKPRYNGGIQSSSSGFKSSSYSPDSDALSHDDEASGDAVHCLRGLKGGKLVHTLKKVGSNPHAVLWTRKLKKTPKIQPQCNTSIEPDLGEQLQFVMRVFLEA
ncbi:hypothetical protein B0H13DRAFT_1852161 [Mycena leptocephala]|nr:hypothetical protein B0H13DRAFT_1852161 [Mycena leptocephala]